MKYHLRRVTSAEFELLAARFVVFDLRFLCRALSLARPRRARAAPRARAPRGGRGVLCVVERLYKVVYGDV